MERAFGSMKNVRLRLLLVCHYSAQRMREPVFLCIRERLKPMLCSSGQRHRSKPHASIDFKVQARGRPALPRF
jgi:hypothetical protein